MLELYHHGSSACSAKVRLALAEKQLQWTSRYLDILAGEQFNPAFLRINPKGVVPVLMHDGRAVRESTVICEYVDEVFPEHRIYPDTPWERAQVRIWTKAVDEELHPACSTITYVVSHRHTILRNGIGSFEQFLKHSTGEGYTARERKWRWIHEGLAAPGVGDQVRLYNAYLRQMDQALREQDWLVSNRLTMADIALAPYVNRLAVFSMLDTWVIERYPRVADWFRRMQARPSYRSALLEWMPETLRVEMAENGRKAWPEVRALLE